MSRRLIAAAGLAVAFALAGCAPVADSIDGADQGPPTDSASGVEHDAMVPEECAGPFPLAFGTPDEANLQLGPAEWPDIPDGAVLCSTGGTVTGQQESADYAYPGGDDAVFAHYEAALAAYAPERVELGTGPALSGAVGDILFVVEPVDGGFTLVFQEEEL